MELQNRKLLAIASFMRQMHAIEFKSARLKTTRDQVNISFPDGTRIWRQPFFETLLSSWPPASHCPMPSFHGSHHGVWFAWHYPSLLPWLASNERPSNVERGRWPVVLPGTRRQASRYRFRTAHPDPRWPVDRFCRRRRRRSDWRHRRLG